MPQSLGEEGLRRALAKLPPPPPRLPSRSLLPPPKGGIYTQLFQEKLFFWFLLVNNPRQLHRDFLIWNSKQSQFAPDTKVRRGPDATAGAATAAVHKVQEVFTPAEGSVSGCVSPFYPNVAYGLFVEYFPSILLHRFGAVHFFLRRVYYPISSLFRFSEFHSSQQSSGV